MSIFGRDHLPVVLQTEATECGLACLVMIARYHGQDVDLNALRNTAAMSLKGANLKQIMAVAGDLHLASRPLRVDLEHLHQVQMPAILHWDMNHFVVLKKIKNGKAHYIDPGRGHRILSLNKVSDHFSGVVLELSPAADFNKIENRLKPKLSDLWQKMTGLKRAIFQILSLSIILQAAILAAPFYLQLVVDKAVTANDSNLLLVLMLGFAGLAVLRALSEAARGWAIIVYGNQMTFQMVGNIFRHLIRLPAAYFEKRYIGDIISRIGSVRPIQKALTESVVAILIDGTMAVLTLAVLYIYSPLLGGVVTLMTGALVLVTLVLYPHLRRTEEEAIIARAIENGHVIESIQASTPIKLFGREAARESSWRNLFAATINASTAHGKFQILQKSAETLLIGLQVVIAVYLGAKLIMSDPSAFTVGMLLAYLFYQNHFTNSVTQLLRQGIEIRLLSLHLDRLADIVYAQSEASAQHRTAPAASEGNIKISNVGFRYSDNDPWVLKDVSLEIDAGSMVAITGKSGGGKTTLIKLILGLYQPVEGSIEVDGHALTDINIADWRAQVGVVMQEDQLLSGTIADNISFFDPEIDMEKVEIAAKLAQIHDEISEMPMKYLSMVGDMGSVLSGGQKQRVLLARALYNDPKVLILDEGTANLDPENEKKIADVLESMTITRIIVAHRPQLIDRSEEIYTI